MPSSQDIAVHEKLLVAKILMEGSKDSKGNTKLSFRNAYEMLLSKQEAESGLVEWVKVFHEKGDWEEDLLYVIHRVLDLPTCPQRWRDNEDLPLEERLKYEDFSDWYAKTDRILDKLLEKYEDRYLQRISYLRKQGSYGGDIREGKEYILKRPIY